MDPFSHSFLFNPKQLHMSNFQWNASNALLSWRTSWILAGMEIRPLEYRQQTHRPLCAHSARPATCTKLLIPQTQCNGSVGLCVSLWRHEGTEESYGVAYKPTVTLHSAASKGWQRWYKTVSLLSETLTNTASSWDFQKMNKPINILCSYSITAVWWPVES